ncbi:MAG: hypothetical protein JWM32_1286 [Verrucomicrobia bacterium]|nr:hypothetical protein [Verrucomicrobiota bacterium]
MIKPKSEKNQTDDNNTSTRTTDQTQSREWRERYPTTVEATAKIDAYIKDNPQVYAKYDRMFSENPDYTKRTMIFKDIQIEGQKYALVKAQVPAAWEFYKGQMPENRTYIDNRLQGLSERGKDIAVVKWMESEQAYANRTAAREQSREIVQQRRAVSV